MSRLIELILWKEKRKVHFFWKHTSDILMHDTEELQRNLSWFFSLQTESFLLCFPYSPTSGASENRDEWRQDITAHTKACTHTHTHTHNEKKSGKWESTCVRNYIERVKWALAKCYGRKNRKPELIPFPEEKGGERNKCFNTHYVPEAVC